MTVIIKLDTVAEKAKQNVVEMNENSHQMCLMCGAPSTSQRLLLSSLLVILRSATLKLRPSRY